MNTATSFPSSTMLARCGVSLSRFPAWLPEHTDENLASAPHKE